MCFSNLPVEFDDDGNPYLADRAEDVDRPGAGTHDTGCGCTADDAAVEADPEGSYEAIVASLPDDARERVAGEGERGSRRPGRPLRDAESVGGD